jgi:hypothetical protein
MRIMYDSVTPTNILHHTTTPVMVAGYANGRYAWTQEEWDLFPRARHIRIAVRANYFDAHVLDCEVGDATPGECPQWALTRRAMGGVPIIYCNRSTWPLVRTAFDNAHIAQPLFWIATANGQADYPQGSIGAQYLLDWQGVDVSAMADFIPGVDPTPTIEHTNTPEDTMLGTATTEEKMIPLPVNGARKLFILTGGKGTVDGHVFFIGDTPSGNKGAYTGDRPIHIDPDRPGPITIPENTRGLTFFHTATADFAIWVA